MGQKVKKKQNFFWIATGGTGGHIFPALSVADELISRGHRVIISTDSRGSKHISRKNYHTCNIWASGVGAKKTIFQVLSMFKILISTVALTVRFMFFRPDKIVAFGGYSSVPVLAAGWIWGIPTFLHEQNAAIGRANKFALRFVKTLMTSFPIGRGIYTGLPIRKEFTSVSWNPTQEFRLLITGGSLGASIIDNVVPKAIKKLKRKIFVIHQTRPENVEKLRKIYAGMKVKNNVLSFIKNMAEELSEASLVISRGGASTIAEMQAVGVPAILVPLGINPDQLANAKAFAKKGGGIVIKQKDFNADSLAKILNNLSDNFSDSSSKLQKMAELAYIKNTALDKIIKIIDA